MMVGTPKRTDPFDTASRSSKFSFDQVAEVPPLIGIAFPTSLQRINQLTVTLSTSILELHPSSRLVQRTQRNSKQFKVNSFHFPLHSLKIQ
jgi:hypothetical protein